MVAGGQLRAPGHRRVGVCIGHRISCRSCSPSRSRRVRAPAPNVPAPVTAYLAGEVAEPGIYTLADGSRLHEFVVAAGGLLPDADAQGINLAIRVTDGQRIIVPRVRPTALASGAPGSIEGNRGSAGHVLNLNTASEAELASLPRIGPVTAAAIVQWRVQNGGFNSVDDLLKVRGIGKATLEGLRPNVTAP